ncbi:MAG TPA: histidine kinase [Croceibacterium sp.]|nr:histidine kinase [Croceibacterium sp.]
MEGEQSMGRPLPIALFVSDAAFLSSLQFSLALDGFILAEGCVDGSFAGECLVIDQRYRGNGLAFLAELRAIGVGAPATLLATNPTRRQHEEATALGAVVIEKPLLGSELTRALQAMSRARNGRGASHTAELKRRADS